MKHALIALLAAACAPLVMPAQAAGQESKEPAWNQADPEMVRLLKIQGDVAKGKVAYEICRGCHKADASGRDNAAYPQLAGQHATVLIKQMVDVRAGRRDSHKMLPFIEKDVVTGDEIAHIAAYLRGLPVPTTNGKGDGKRLELGQHLYDRDCASCHGKQGEGNGEKFYPMVAGQHYTYLYRETLESRDKGRRNSNPEMVKVLKHYVDSDIAAVSDYMSRLTVGAKP
ncbi:MAG: c-type cytochrome [Thiobacillaceae bacterium]|jgi:cytochrome c553|nr:c-type cytochrome [Thiobacillaceae bacterium]